MLRLASLLVLAGLLSSSLGCSICCAPFDKAYGAYGGVVEREDLYHGRVGSIFDPAGATVVHDAAETDGSVIVEPETPFEAVPSDEAPRPELPADDSLTLPPLQ